jgi:hypothetical protein
MGRDTLDDIVYGDLLSEGRFWYESIVTKQASTIIAVCIGMLWLGEAHAARFERHAANVAVPIGTVYDATTKLLWEQKTEDGSVHDVKNLYTWSSTGEAPDGTAFTTFLATLNNGNAPYNAGTQSPITGCFAHHCDWRLPRKDELQEILDLGATGCGKGSPCIDPIFGPTENSYWSATDAGANAWYVYFVGGPSPSWNAKILAYYVRAVRSGL